MVQKDTLLIGDQKILIFKAQVQQGDQFIFPTPKNPITEGVEIVGVPKIDTIGVKDGLIDIESQLIVTSFDSGSYKLPPFPAYRIKSSGEVDTLWFDGGPLEVKTIQIDTTTYNPFDVKGQLNYPFSFRELLPWAGVLLLIAAISYLVYRIIKNRRENRDIFGRAKVEDPAHIVALKKLEKLRNGKMWMKDQKQFFTEVIDTLREYMERRYSIQTMEKTSGEILEELSKVNMEPKVYIELEELLKLSDLVKFAKYRAEEQECERAIPMSVRFVNATFLQEIESDVE
jgi:hypothetical protein